ncbi:DUF3293 domain-containing protein [Leptobacterium flavescens]|uniref:DUF3293 domain-containing protein n=1 Tax=Leptobacterium flavescens TaxID=472055 RepID=A0A6P0UL80_9FLAO|nr:DUF3293 domain-containing protein [Leptobacterium flavescens]NER11813.1 DUF3293 domain-containing protein [Leptobacterium flavescens]
MSRDLTAESYAFLEKAYKETTYEVKALSQVYKLKIGERHAEFLRFLEEENIDSWSVISAFNPYSRELSNKENENRHLNFITALDKKEYRVFEAKGVPADDNWEAEKSLFIGNISRERAMDIGKRLEQNAIVFGTKTTRPEIIWLVNRK